MLEPSVGIEPTTYVTKGFLRKKTGFELKPTMKKRLRSSMIAWIVNFPLLWDMAEKVLS